MVKKEKKIMDKILRLQISEKQENVLKSYHEKGMISTKREIASLIRQCSAEVVRGASKGK